MTARKSRAGRRIQIYCRGQFALEKPRAVHRIYNFSGGHALSEAAAEYSFAASGEENALTDDAPETNMLRNVTAEFRVN
jgi:hypothetical protein